MESNRELFEAFNRDVYRTCYYMVHNAADAEDLTQEVFITVFRSNREHIEHLRAWIMKITVNHCLNHLRRRRSLNEKVADHPYLFTGNEEKPVDRLAEERESTVEWAGYMKRLPDKIRAVVTLRYMHDFSLTEISGLLSIPLGTTKSRLHKGLRLMKGILLEAGVHTQDREEEAYGQNRAYAKASIK
ncbi:RNA polymerase sigma factor [Paenibacillus sp. NPDC057934]|uniref:RNA polymerase sigma factor n=1 Tax=Paenibacillus sp. NPDC057934 TaxID=3346282 RepID=UPI0036DF5DF4